MPSLSDLLRVGVVGAQVGGGVLNRRTAGRATNRLTAGVDQAIGTINTGADRARTTMAGVYQDQKDTLAPFSAAGTKTLADLQAGLEPGGGLADPFTADYDKFFNDPQIQRRIAEGNKLLARKQASGGSLSSGAAIKAARDYNDYQIGNEFDDWRSGEERIFRQNQYDRLGALMDLEGIGLQGIEAEINAGSQYGGNLARLEQTIATQVADLETDRASAEAAGDIAKANSITDTINGVLDTVDKLGIGKTLANAAPKVGAAAGAGMAAAGGALGATGGGAAIGGMTLPGFGLGSSALAAGSIPSAGAVSAGGMAGSGSAVGGGGVMPTITSFLMNNPWTVGVGAALLAGTAILKSQAHWEANEMVKKFENPYHFQFLKPFVAQFNSAAQSGQLSGAEAAALLQQFDQSWAAYQQKAREYGKGGKDEKKVSDQSIANLSPIVAKIRSDSAAQAGGLA